VKKSANYDTIIPTPVNTVNANPISFSKADRTAKSAIILKTIDAGGKIMAQVLVRDLENDVVDKLKERAKSRGRSLEAELRLILQQAAIESSRTRPALSIEEIQKMLAGRTFSDSTEMLREDRER